MKLEQTIINKTFVVSYYKKTYYIDYLESDGYCLQSFNRFNWEIRGEDNEELQTYALKEMSEKEKQIVERNQKIEEKLISFCIKHFNDYSPEL